MRDSKIVSEIPPHSVHGLRIEGYDVISVNVFHFTLMKFHFKTRIIQCVLYYLRHDLEFFGILLNYPPYEARVLCFRTLEAGSCILTVLKIVKMRS